MSALALKVLGMEGNFVRWAVEEPLRSRRRSEDGGTRGRSSSPVANFKSIDVGVGSYVLACVPFQSLLVLLGVVSKTKEVLCSCPVPC